MDYRFHRVLRGPRRTPNAGFSADTQRQVSLTVLVRSIQNRIRKLNTGVEGGGVYQEIHFPQAENPVGWQPGLGFEARSSSGGDQPRMIWVWGRRDHGPSGTRSLALIKSFKGGGWSHQRTLRCQRPLCVSDHSIRHHSDVRDHSVSKTTPSETIPSDTTMMSVALHVRKMEGGHVIITSISQHRFM